MQTHGAHGGMAALLLVCSVAAVALVVVWMRHVTSLRRDSSKGAPDAPLPRGSMGWPLIGETLAWIRDPPTWADAHVARYGPVFKTHLLFRPTVFVSGGDNVRALYRKEGREVEGLWPASTVRLLGDVLSNAKAAAHSRRRRALAGAYSSKAVATYVPDIVRVVGRTLSEWERDLGVGHAHAGGGGARMQSTVGLSHDVVPLVKRLMLRVAWEVIVSFPSGDPRCDTMATLFSTWKDGLFSFPIDLPFTAFGKALRARSGIIAIIRANVARLRAQQAASVAAGEDLPHVHGVMARLLREHPADAAGGPSASQEVTDATLCDEALLQLFAGHDTTTSTALGLLWRTAQHQEWQGRLRDEQTRVVESHGAELTPDALGAMPVLDRVINEVLRLLSPTGGGFRRARTSFELAGVQVPAGATILYSLIATHRDAAAFAHPLTFQPDRFEATSKGAGADEPAASPPSTWAASAASSPSFLPFGGGARSCIGRNIAMAQLRVLAASLLRRFKWRVDGDDNAVEWSTFPIPLPRHGLQLVLSRV